MLKIAGHPLFELMVNVLVLMALFSAVKMLFNLGPDSGIPGDIKKFFMMA